MPEQLSGDVRSSTSVAGTSCAAFPITLALDTSGPHVQLALATKDHIEVLTEPVARGHAEILFERIAHLMERAGLGWSDIGRIATSTGPGSFTGLRIGIAAARGLGLARQCPVVGIPNLLALSLGVSLPSGSEEAGFSITLDARRKQAYVQHFRAPGVPAAPPRLVDQTGEKTVFDSPLLDIGRLARFAASVAPADFPPDPCYVRPPDAKPQIRPPIDFQAPMPS